MSEVENGVLFGPRVYRVRVCPNVKELESCEASGIFALYGRLYLEQHCVCAAGECEATIRVSHDTARV